MIDRLHHRGWHYVFLICVSLLFFFGNLGGPTLWDMDEGKNITCAREMMEANNWVIPTFNARLRVDKPVLLYWLQILSFHAFGVNEYSGRFPSAVAALLSVLMAYELTRSMFTRTTALLAGIIVATAPMMFAAAHFANPDALLNAYTVLTLAAFWLGRRERRWWWFASISAAEGLGFLAKGPVGLVLPTAVITLFLLWERQLCVYWDRRWLIGCWTFTLVALPWYIWVSADTRGDFLRGFFWTHHVQRVHDRHVGPPRAFQVITLVVLLDRRLRPGRSLSWARGGSGSGRRYGSPGLAGSVHGLTQRSGRPALRWRLRPAPCRTMRPRHTAC